MSGVALIYGVVPSPSILEGEVALPASLEGSVLSGVVAGEIISGALEAGVQGSDSIEGIFTGAET